MGTNTLTSPIKAIRAYCLDCSGGNAAEVNRCVIERCELYPFRFGKNPFHKRASTKTKQKLGVDIDD